MPLIFKLLALVCSMSLTARYTMESLMWKLIIRGVVRGHGDRTTIPGHTPERLADHIQSAFSATRPSKLWVADIINVATLRGVVWVAFVIDVFARRIVG